MKNKKFRKYIFLILILFISIGFAILSTNLSINGLFNFTPNTWKIYLDNVVVDDSSTTTELPTINSDKDTLSFTSTLNKPGDYYAFNVDVRNDSTIDAMLGSITVAGLEDVSNYLDCIVTYSNGTTPNPNDILYKTARVTFNIKLVYKDITREQIPSEVLTPIVTVTINYRQANNNAVVVSEINHWNFDFTGNEQSLILPTSGTYKLETWGGKGGDDRGNSNSETMFGGYGGYSLGAFSGQSGEKLFVFVGSGCINSFLFDCIENPFNGGGIMFGSGIMGGGATHIALTSGELKTLESYKGNLVDNKYYVSDKILIVSGGGGGGSDHYRGGSGGGYIGNNADAGEGYNGFGGTQISGYSFGKGEDAGQNVLESEPTNYQNPAGGGGFFGGNAGSMHVYSGGGGGSGYIASSKLISTTNITKHMTCYNCATSDEVETKTVSTSCKDEKPIPDCSKIGNGYAKITFMG